MFLGISPTVANWSPDGKECSLLMDDNPLVDFVELPDTCQGLSYCNILCGVLRGALEMVQFCPTLVPEGIPHFSVSYSRFVMSSLRHVELEFGPRSNKASSSAFVNQGLKSAHGTYLPVGSHIKAGLTGGLQPSES